MYDFKRTITSASVIASMLLPIILSLVIFALILGSGGGGVSNTNSVSTLMYFDNSGYHFLSYSANQYGQPVGGATVSFNFSETSGAKFYGGGGTTNASGLSQVLIQAPNASDYAGQFTVSPPGSVGAVFNQICQLNFDSFFNGSFQPAVPGEIVAQSCISPPTFSTVIDSSNSSRRLIQVFFSGPGGSIPNYEVYYKLYNYSNSKSVPAPLYFNQSQMQVLGTLNNYHQTFSLTLPQNETCIYTTITEGGGVQITTGCISSLIYLEIFDPSGTPLQVDQIPESDLFPQPTPPVQASSAASTFFSAIFAIFIPLTAIIGAYSSYGKDRVTGVLESVLVRPVTRKSLSISRYLSTLLALGIGVVISTGIVDLILWHYAGSFLDTGLMLTTIGALLVDLAAFIGIMFFLSHLSKSSGELIGIGITLFIVLDFLWSLILTALTFATGGNFGSAIALQVNVYANYFNPAQFVSLVYDYLTNSLGGVTVQPAAYGITIPALGADAILWIALPFAIYLYLATKRD